jgi:outer membrane protein assembly factor BamD
MTDTYPLYSNADEALFTLGQSYERELDRIRNLPTNRAFTEQKKAQLIKLYTDGADQAYSKIITRYPVMPRVEDAKARLKALDLAVPTPTQEAIEQNKKEEASRGELGRVGRIMLTFHKTPDFKPATTVGEPTLVDPKETSAPELIKEANEIVTAVPKAGDNKVGIDTVSEPGGKIPENQPIPRSDSGDAGTDKTDVPKEAPAQVNEAGNSSSNPGDASASANGTSGQSTAARATDGTNDGAESSNKKDTQQVSSSKPKKKKGLRKIIPF